MHSLIQQAKQANDLERLALYDFTWWLWAHDKQLLPESAVMKILALCGRGFGKTRLGSENTIERAQKEPIQIALVARTLKDGERIMINSPKSGLLVRSPPWFEAKWISSKHELHWPNGSRALLFSSEEPESLRGNEFHFAWADELCAWIFMRETWAQLILCLRLGLHPQVVATTTPKPQKLIRELYDDPHVFKIRGTTFDNAANLPKAQLEELLREFGGTRRGRQELYAEILDQLEGTLWKMERAKLPGGLPDLSDTPGIEDLRVRRDQVPRLVRVTMGIDPAITDNPWSDLTGIVIVGLGEDGHLYVLDDVSMRGKPNEWAEKVFEAVERWNVTKIVPETNRGGDLVETTLRYYAQVHNKQLPEIQPINSQEGKVGRAEPISALYDQGRVHHVGHHADLEDEQCNWQPFPGEDETDDDSEISDRTRRRRKRSPNRVDALVFACADLKPNMPDWDMTFNVIRPPDAPANAEAVGKISERARPASDKKRWKSRWRQ